MSSVEVFNFPSIVAGEAEPVVRATSGKSWPGIQVNIFFDNRESCFEGCQSRRDRTQTVFRSQGTPHTSSL